MHDPAELDQIEQRYVRGLWRLTMAEIAADREIDLARFGPVQVAIVGQRSEEPLVNVVLGAGSWGAVEGGHLADAIDWACWRGVDYRVPVTPGLPGSRSGEHWLMEGGHEQGSTWMKFARDTGPSTSEEPRGVEVFEAGDEVELCEGFIQLADESFWGARCLGSWFSDLAERKEWRCYVAYGEDGYRSCGAVMLAEGRFAELGALLSTENEDRELQVALLRRCIRDAAAAGCRAIFAEAELADVGDGLSSGAETLMATGFRPIFRRTEWRPPRLAPDPIGTTRTDHRNGPRPGP